MDTNPRLPKACAPEGESLREVVLASVEAFDAETARERESRERVLSELRCLPSPFDRYAAPVHVTGSAVVVGPWGTVLHRHKRLGIWLQPGGHLDAGEAPWAAALRETQEETGLTGALAADRALFHLDVHEAGEHLHLDLRYLLRCYDRVLAPGPDESQEVRWFDLASATGVADIGLVDAIERLGRMEATS